MITYFAFLFGLCCGLLVCSGIWLSVIVSDGFKYLKYEIHDTSDWDNKHSALPEKQ